MEKLYVIKIGGTVIEDDNLFLQFVTQFASIKGRKILVHGGGKIATEIGNSLGIQPKYHEGRRITDDDTLRLVTMVYGGLVNKKIVSALQSKDCNAIGLTGADGNVLSATKRVNAKVDFGWVGDTDETKVNAKLIELLLENDYIPVMAPLTHDEGGNILNTNADTIASVVALAMSKKYEVHLIFCFDKKGVLGDEKDDSTVIPVITRKEFVNLKEENKIHSGILPKIENALNAASKGIKEVIIGSVQDLLVNTTSAIAGTRIISEGGQHE